jgi:hypothetical protein
MADVDKVIALMVANKEPKEKIIEFINNYKKQKAASKAGTETEVEENGVPSTALTKTITKDKLSGGDKGKGTTTNTVNYVNAKYGKGSISNPKVAAGSTGPISAIDQSVGRVRETLIKSGETIPTKPVVSKKTTGGHVGDGSGLENFKYDHAEANRPTSKGIQVWNDPTTGKLVRHPDQLKKDEEEKKKQEEEMVKKIRLQGQQKKTDESKYSKEHGGYGKSEEEIKLELDLKPKLFNPAREVTPTATPGYLIGQTPNTPYPFISKVEDAVPDRYYQNQKTSQTYQFREGKYVDLELSKTVDQIEKVINNNLAGAFGKTNYFAEEKITPEINLLIKPYGWTVTEGDGINAVKLQKGDIIQNFDLNDENIAETIANFVANPPKKSAEWNYDKGQFNTYMEKYYTPEMIKRLTSKEYLANVADEDDFLDQIKEDLGYGFIREIIVLSTLIYPTWI